MSTNVRLAGGALLALLVGLAVVLLFPPAAEDPATGAPEQVAAAQAPTATGTPQTAAAPDSDAPAGDAAAAPETATSATDATEDPATGAPETAAPSFDTFRLDPDGAAVLAGRGAPGKTVAIMLGEERIDTLTADAQGNFVALLTLPPSDAPRTLRLVADPDGAAVSSDQTLIVAPVTVAAASAEGEPDPAAAADAALADGAGASDNAASPPGAGESGLADAAGVAQADGTADATAPAPAGDTAPPDPAIALADSAAATAPAAGTGAEDGAGDGATAEAGPAAAPPVLISDAAGVRVLQPAAAAPDVADAVALDTITYDPAGEVQLAGRAGASARVQVYLDNRPLTASPVGPEGDWQIDLPQIDTGVYTLRIDAVTDAGEVVSRIETPFRREEAATVAAVMAEDTAAPGFEVAFRTVQPGATLWAIARERYGEGIRYVEVFEANRDLIRNPDLIYPGQVFRLPDGAPPAD